MKRAIIITTFIIKITNKDDSPEPSKRTGHPAAVDANAHRPPRQKTQCCGNTFSFYDSYFYIFYHGRFYIYIFYHCRFYQDDDQIVIAGVKTFVLYYSQVMAKWWPNDNKMLIMITNNKNNICRCLLFLLPMVRTLKIFFHLILPFPFTMRVLCKDFGSLSKDFPS